jgi:threonine/homoserine/homoserine lactone efflux protein
VISLGQLVALTLACTVVIVIPGPSVMFIIGRALSYGRRTALASVVGNSIGSYLAAVLISVGLGPLLQRSDLLFSAIKWAGAGYLVWLGIQAFRHAGPLAGDAVARGATLSPWRSIRTGVMVGVTNPKTFIVFAAILPQFVDAQAGRVPAQMLLLAVVPIGIGLVTDSGWASVAGRARDWLASSPRRMTALGRIGGLSMIGLGVSVAVTGRRD